jgi:bidirectional [NiFe] hydrogenase diaphorase subunit
LSVYTLRIDGTDVAGAAGQSILDVAAENGVEIPTLCHLEGLSDVGACRLCVVEVGASGKLLPACVTAVEEGMEVTAHSNRLASYRRTVGISWPTSARKLAAPMPATPGPSQRSLGLVVSAMAREA